MDSGCRNRQYVAACLFVMVSLAPIGLRADGAPADESHPQTRDRPSPAPKVIQRSVDLQTNRWELYPHREDVALVSMERLRDGFGIELRVQNSRRDFSHFLYSVNGAKAQRSTDGRIPIRFEDKHSPAMQATTTTIKAVAATGAESKPYTISINFYPKELYTAGGLTAPGYIIIQQTDLALTTSRVEDWILHRPAPGDIDFARKTWGHLFSANRSDYENACALAKSIMDDLESHRGMPSDEMGKLAGQASHASVSAYEKVRKAHPQVARQWFDENQKKIAETFKQACAIARDHDILFHTDAAQSVGKIATRTGELGVDLVMPEMGGRALATWMRGQLPTRSLPSSQSSVPS